MHTARDVVALTIERLRVSDAPRETRVAALRGSFGRTKLRAVGDVWRLGVLCLAADGGVFATGDVLVVTEPTHPNHRNALAVERNEMRAVLRRAGIPAGATVVLNARPLDLDAPESPLVVNDDGLGVVWVRGGAAVPLGAYLAERADLLLNPPTGA